MDKETLSNYGWIVICVLVLAVMIALATPFGTFVADAIKSTTQGLFDVNQNALNSTGLINIGDKEFQCDHEYENSYCKHCGAVDPNHTHTYPATGLTAKCENCDYIKDHTCSYGSDNLCTMCGEEKILDYELKAADYKAKTGIDISSGDIVIPETFTALDGTKYRVTSIGNYAFCEYSSLTSVTLPDSVTGISSYAFQKCTSLKNINIPEGVTYIGVCAFQLCDSLESVVIPSTVRSIQGGAFYGCDVLTTINIPVATTYVGESTFNFCPLLTNISVDENNTSYCSVDGVLYSKDMKTIVRYPEGKIGTTYTIPSGVTKINDYAFRGCKSLTSIDIPNGVTVIGESAFHSCGSLTSIIIPEGVTTIDYETFAFCTSLINVTVPSTITNIDYEIFDSAKTTTINYNGTVEQWNAITKNNYWNNFSKVTKVICTDGTVTLS